MTPNDDQIRATMRDYASTLEPPPLADVIARAEVPEHSAVPSSGWRPRRRGRLLLAVATGIVAVAAATVVTTATTDQDTSPSAEATQPVGAGAVGAPGCPPGLPTPDLSLGEGRTIAAKSGETLTIPLKVPPTNADRHLRTLMVYLMPPGIDMNERDKAIAQSAVVDLAADQQRVSPVLQIPSDLAPGTYDLIGTATWPGPSLCGAVNPADSTQTGTSWGALLSIVIA